MIKFNEVTWYSKLAAVIFFLGVLPVLTFYIGVRYQETQSVLTSVEFASDISKSQKLSSIDSSVWNIKYVTKNINGFDMPQIVDFSDKEIMQKVNNQIAEIANNFGCMDDILPSPHNSYDSKVSVSYSKNDIFSVSIHNSWYCGGPYPTNDSNESVTFDMKTGKIVDLEGLFENYKKDKKAIMAVIFSEQIKKYSGARSDQSCNGLYDLEGEGDRLDFTEFISFEIVADGITAQPSFPHVIEACSEEAYASAESLSDFWGPTSILSRLK